MRVNFCNRFWTTFYSFLYKISTNIRIYLCDYFLNSNFHDHIVIKMLRSCHFYEVLCSFASSEGNYKGHLFFIQTLWIFFKMISWVWGRRLRLAFVAVWIVFWYCSRFVTLSITSYHWILHVLNFVAVFYHLHFYLAILLFHNPWSHHHIFQLK